MLRAQLKLVFGFLVLGAIAFMPPAAAQAQQEVVVVNEKPVPVRDVDARATTHLGRKTSEMVSLVGLFNMSNEIFFKRSLPNGKEEPFTIPQGKILVITDIHWQVNAGNPGTVCRLSLNVDNVANPVAFTRLVYNSVLTLNSGGVDGSHDRLTAGILVSSAAKLRATLTIPTGALESFFLIGYFVPEE